MTEKEQALAYLGRDPVLNISMTEPLRLGRAHVAARSSRGVVLEMDGIAMVAAEAPDEALRLLEAVPEANTWNVMGGALTQAVAEALDGLPAHKLHCSVLAEEAIKKALQDYFDRKGIPYDEKDFPACEHCAHCESV